MKKTKIMIIDNDLDFTEAAKSTLEHAGYEVHLAQSGKRGLESTRKVKPELVILDAILPDVNGFSVCRDIKDDPGLSTVRVIMLTALAISQDSYVAKIAMEHKADAFLYKPIDTKTLAERVSSFLSASAPIPKEAHTKARILLIDGDADSLNATQQILLANQFEVMAAKDGEEGIAKAKYENPDLIVLDVVLPGKDGYTVCYELRKIEQTRSIPVVLLTAFGKQLSNPEYAIDIAIDHLADDYIAKPFDTQTLLRKIEKLLRFEGKV